MLNESNLALLKAPIALTSRRLVKKTRKICYNSVDIEFMEFDLMTTTPQNCLNFQPRRLAVLNSLIYTHAPARKRGCSRLKAVGWLSKV